MDRSTITVITPFHNTDHELFSSAAASMEAQILSPDRIEWIIVIHNCDPSYSDFVRKRTAHLQYVRIYELNNDKHTASSPRNFALERVHGTYITFLDSDDQLTPRCLSTIISGMDKTGADLGKYRGERQEEDDSISSFLDNRVRFSQIKPLLCIKKGDPELKKLLTMANMMMSCQVIRSAFLQEHHIRFREDIKYEEDVVFNLECLSFAASVAVFPQLIGYIYIMHHGSTMQSAVLSEERLLRICHDLSKQLALGLELGFDMRYLFLGHMKMVAEEIKKKQWDISVRRDIRECFLPFYQSIKRPEPHEKFLSASELRRISEENERIVLGFDLFDDGAEVLRRILKDKQDTELGDDWDFETIKTIEEYQKRVPVTDYDTYSPFIELTTRIGESDIFCSEPIKGYALTSGSSGRRKMIPYTARQAEENADELRALLSQGGSTFLLMQSIRSENKYADGTYLDSVTGAALQAIEHELRYESFRLPHSDGAVTSPRKHYFTPNGLCSYHEKLLYALLDRNVTRIIAPFSWYLLDMFHYLEKHYDLLLSDMREGRTLGGEQHPERADELAEVFAQGFETPILPRIWPGLKTVIAGGSGEFRIYTRQIRRYAGGRLFEEELYAASEGIFARFDKKHNKYRLLQEKFFYEFREIYHDGTTGDILPAREVKDGARYELIVTNDSGFYRYAIGDVIRAEKEDDGRLFIDLLYRRNDELHIPGTSGIVTPDLIYEAVDSLIKELDLPAGDYSYALSEDEQHLELFLEQKGHGDDQLSSFDRDTVALNFDRLLRGLCKSYDTARESVMKNCKVFYTEAETQAAYREICVHRSRLTPDQMKPVRLIDNPVKRRFFRTFLIG